MVALISKRGQFPVVRVTNYIQCLIESKLPDLAHTGSLEFAYVDVSQIQQMDYSFAGRLCSATQSLEACF